MMDMFSNIVIVKLMLLPTTRDYEGSYRRSVNLNLTYNTYRSLENIMLNNPLGPNSQISTMNIANGLSDIISYNPMVSNIIIPNGISTKRYIFVLRVDVPDLLTVYYIQGYTDFYDPSISGKIDPNMNFNINTIHEFQRSINQFNMNTLKHTTSYNLLQNGSISNINNIYQNNDMLIRPTDVYTGLMINSISDENNLNVNLSSRYNHDVKTSNKENIEPVRYLEKIINSYITSNNINRDVDDADSLLGNCAYFVSEPLAISNIFLLNLSKIKNINNATSFTLNDLSVMDNSLLTNPNGRFELFENQGYREINNVNNFISVGKGENQLQPKSEVIIANRVIHSVTALMSECLITCISFSFTNMTIDNQPLLTITHSNSFLEGVNIIYFTNILETRIKSYLIPNIISYGLNISMHVIINIIEDSVISINVNNNGDVVFVFPTFCDSLINPLITNHDNYENIVRDFDNLTEVMNNSISNIVIPSNIGNINYN